MQNINPLTALRSLKGAPLSCLVALMFAIPTGRKRMALPHHRLFRQTCLSCPRLSTRDGICNLQR